MFRKIFLIILCLFVLSGSAFATDYFLDLSHDQANGGDGTTMQTDGGADDAFKTFAQAYASVGTGDTCWIRRTSGSATAQGVAKKIDSYVWVGTTDGVIVLNQNLTGEDLYVHMGRISNRREPLDRITLHGVALQHSAVDRVLDSGGNQAHKIQARVQGKSRNNEPNPSKTLDFVGQHFDEVDHLSIRGGASGNYVTLELLYDGKDDQAWGPLYAEMEGMPDGG